MTVTSGMAVDANTLCLAFTATLSAEESTRKEAEELLKRVSLSPGLLILLTQILSNKDIDLSVRTSAAVFLKNEVRQHWDVSDSSSAKVTYPNDQKNTVRDVIISILETSIDTIALANSVSETIRWMILSDYPESWPGVFQTSIERIEQRSSVQSVRAALVVIRLIVKSFEYKVTQSQLVVPDAVKRSFTPLLALAADLIKEKFLKDEVTSIMMKTICQIYWSCTQSATTTEEIGTSLKMWMELMYHIIETPVPIEVVSTVTDLEAREALQQFKAKKWAMKIISRFLCCFGPSHFSRTKKNDLQKAVGDVFIGDWAPKFLHLNLNLLEMEKKGTTWISDRMKKLLLQYLTQSLELAITYKTLKPHVEKILFEVVFPLLCYNEEDVEKWNTDPAEFVRSQGILLCAKPRDCAIDFLQALTRLRSRDFFDSVSNFVQNILITQASASDEEKRRIYNSQKYGALLMVGAISDRLTSKKRRLQVEPFLNKFVLPELTNTTDPFLRLRACWTYSQFLDPDKNGLKKIQDPEKFMEAFTKVIDLCSDPELPIRIQAGIALRPFLEIEDPHINQKMSAHIPTIMEKLFTMIAQVPDNEMIVMTLESLVLHYEELMPPYAVQLISYLGPTLIRLIDVANGNEEKSPSSVVSSIAFDEDDSTITAMSVAQAMSSVLSTLVEPKFHPFFEQVAPVLCPVLDRMLSPEGLDFVDDALVLLTYLSFYCPNLSQPTDLWKYFERMYQVVCGGSSAHLQLEGVCASGWAPDYLDKMLPTLDNYISRDCDRFANGISTLQNKSFKQLLLEIAAKCMSLNAGDAETPQHALELMMLLYEGFIGKAPMVDDLMAPCLELFWNHIKCVQETINRPTLSLCIRLLSTMIVYNPSLFLHLCEKATLSSDVFQLFSQIEAVKTHEGKKVFVLAFSQLLNLSTTGDLPPALSGSSIEIARAIGVQLKKFVELKRKAEENSSEDDFDTDDDSEQDINENEDAGHVQEALIKKLEAAASNEEDDDDEDYDEPEAATDDFPVRHSPLDDINELVVVKGLMTKLPQVFKEALGELDCGLLIQFIDGESERRRLAEEKSPTISSAD